MHIKKTYAMAAAALMAALSVVLLLIGVYIPVNTLFLLRWPRIWPVIRSINTE